VLGVGEGADEGGHGQERHRVEEQHGWCADEADQEPAGGGTDQGAQLVADAEQGVGALQVGLVDQAGEDRADAGVGGRDEGAGGQREGVDQGHVEAAEPVQDRDGPHQHGPEQVVGDHHPPGRPAVEQAAEQRTGDHRRQPGAEQDQPDGHAGPGEVEHEPQQGDGGELVAGARQQQSGRQPPHPGPAEGRPLHPRIAAYLLFTL
jgi:hypothetical protein